MKNLLPCLLACVFAACSPPEGNNAPAENAPPTVTVPLDGAAAAKVTSDMLTAMQAGSGTAMREFFIQKERLMGDKADAVTFNPDGKMTGYTLGEPKVEGERCVVPATLSFKDLPDKTYQVVLKREDNQWRVSMADTVKQSLFGNKDKD